MISKIRKIKNGILLSLLATFFFSISSVLVKLIAPRIPSTEMALFRSLIGLIIVVVYMRYNNYTFKVPKQRVLLLRGFLGGVSLLCSFYAISKMKLGEISILFQLAPVFVALFAHVILNEKLPKFFYILLVSSLAGCVLVIKPSFANLGNIPALAGIAAAILAALACVCIRSLSREHKTHIIVLYFCFTAMLVPVPWVSQFVIPDYYDFFILIAIGVIATLSQFFMTKAYAVEKAGIVSMIGYTGVFFNVIWGILIWREFLDVYSIIGGILILFSCVILSLKLYQNSKNIDPVLPGD